MNIYKTQVLLEKLDKLDGVYQGFKARKTHNIPLAIQLSSTLKANFNISQNAYDKIRVIIMRDMKKQINQVRKEIENEVKI